MLPILLPLGFILLLLFVVIAGQPDEFKVTRSATIPAAPSSVFPHVNCLRLWEAWSPWAKLDPNAKSVFEGPAESVGAIMRWAGNQKIGEGSMTITESSANELVRFRLEFLKPFKATNTAEFIFRPENGQTIVTWSMFGKNHFAGKIFGLILNCENRVGRSFDQGLAQLAAAVQAAPKK
jgi:hypothetical protein